MLPLMVQTHLWPVALWIAVLWSTVFFIFVPGRMVPAMAIVTSAVQPRLRGTFLSMNGAVQQLASGTASWVGGAMIAADASGRIVGYDKVGWLADKFAAVNACGSDGFVVCDLDREYIFKREHAQRG